MLHEYKRAVPAKESVHRHLHLGLIAFLVKKLIVRVALWGLIPAWMAERLIRWGGLRHA